MNGPTSATSSSVSAEIVSENQERRGMAIRNLSTCKVFLGFGGKAELNKGKVLYPNEEFVMDAFSFFWGSVTAVSADAGCLLAIQEF